MAPRAALPDVAEIAAFLRAAGVHEGARVLDVPCGLGRRAHALAEHGFRVTAVDPNDVAIQALQKRAGKASADRLAYRSAPAGALPGLPAADRFDVILCLDHAVCRDPPADDAALLGRLRGHLAPGGILVLDVLHRDFFAARPRPFVYHVIGSVEQHEFRTFDAATGILELTWRFYQREGTDLRFRGTTSARVRLAAPHEVAAILADAGWTVDALYGGWGKEAVSSDRRKLLFVARPREVK